LNLLTTNNRLTPAFFASKTGGQFATEFGGQFERNTQIGSTIIEFLDVSNSKVVAPMPVSSLCISP